ncbi:hypothetical protein LZ554_007776 [Drepanopeziza brunnea f. sp. 'monogermtubi']|nr:hypothetical protein LZ554_007776 [Drepanopeziza brunnea f. sp. 'monogermtubi']
MLILDIRSTRSTFSRKLFAQLISKCWRLGRSQEMIRTSYSERFLLMSWALKDVQVEKSRTREGSRCATEYIEILIKDTCPLKADWPTTRLNSGRAQTTVALAAAL